ncbi:MAG: biopolymer transporter ExbD [Lentisphaeria bacterium]|nr:biopolymer transporter ExbD [Lentisphaeria bacterium]
MAQKRRKAVSAVQIPMSSMIDVVFLLLIYFIVTQKDELSEAHLAVNLPSPSPAQEQPQEKPNLLEIEVHPGQVYLKKIPQTLPQLKETLSRFAAYDSEQTVIVKTSVMAETHELVSVLDLCKGLGLTRLNVLTLQ